MRQRWPAAIHLAHWPYALRSAAHLHNTLPVLEDGTSRLERFSSIRVVSKMKHHHAFGCPVFALENDLTAGSPILHWSPRARLGINLGSSPSHARNVYLMLNLHMGCVSLQYRCHFDNFFETVRHGEPDVSVPLAWQQLSGLIAITQTPSINTTMKFCSLLNACSLKMIQLRILKNLTTPSLLVTSPAHPSFLISLCRISTMISLSQQSMRE